MRPKVFRTRITDLFGIRHPILCGGLIWLADAHYVAAVVNAGAMGFITALSFPEEPERFRVEVRRCRALTNGAPFGVSIAFSMQPNINDRLAAYVSIIAEEQVAFVETSGGNPKSFIGALKEAGCVVIHKAPTVRHALSAARCGVDAIAVIGGESGGHPGVEMTGTIVQGVLAADAIELPLAIGGGMGTGRQLAAALALGADAMLMGSRMLVAEEIWADPNYKQRIIEAYETDTRVVMKQFRGNRRVLDNDTARAVEELEARNIDTFAAYAEHVSGRLTRRAYETGDWTRGLLDLGPAAIFARRIESVEAIIDSIIDEARETVSHLRTLRVPPMEN